RRLADRGACRRCGHRPQSHQHRRALPSCARARRLAHRLCRRAAAQACSAATRIKSTSMKRSDIVELVVLAALWGASFLFTRMGAAEFGPVALAFVRVVGASCFLLPLLAWRGEFALLRRHWRPLLVIGITNSALPFLCFSFAALSITAG